MNNKVTGKRHLVRSVGGVWSHVYRVGPSPALPAVLLVLSPQELEAEGQWEIHIRLWPSSHRVHHYVVAAGILLVGIKRASCLPRGQALPQFS